MPDAPPLPGASSGAGDPAPKHGPKHSVKNGGGPGNQGRAGAGTAGRRRSWLLPALLVFGLLAGVGGVVVLHDPATAGEVGGGSTVTPVLSARRAPELLTAPLAEQRLSGELEAWVPRSPADSCLVVEEAGTSIYSHNADLPVAGASTQKVVTATAALLAFGPDHRFETVAASPAPVEDGVLTGDLYVVGGGDPLLTTEGYRNQLTRGQERMTDVGDLARVIADAGITSVEGSVVGDDSRYDEARFHDAWPDRFRQQNQAGPVSALNVNDGFADFPAESGAGLAAKVPAPDPAANAASVITDQLEARGVSVSGEPGSGTAPDGAEPVAVLESAPLADITAQMLIDSDNDTGEMLFKELGLEVEGSGTWEAGAAAVRTVLTDAGADLEGLTVVDGSGLSRDNRLSCGLLVELLARSDTGPVVIGGLAVAGETGTLADDYNGTPVEGRLLGKTGTLRDVNALTGEVHPVEGGLLTYAYVANVPDPQELTPAEVALTDPLGGILVDHSAGVEIDLVLPEGYPSDAEPAGTEDEGADGAAEE